MSYSEDEVEKLKGYLKEILDEHYLELVNELKRKLALGQEKERELGIRLDKYEKDHDAIKKCHECHRTNVKYKEEGTQTSPVKTIEQNECLPMQEASKTTPEESIETKPGPSIVNQNNRHEPPANRYIDTDVIVIDDSD